MWCPKRIFKACLICLCQRKGGGASILPQFKRNTFPETNIAPENGWLEDFPFLKWLCGMCELFCFREGISIDYNRHQVDPTKKYTRPLATGRILGRNSRQRFHHLLSIEQHPNKKNSDYSWSSYPPLTYPPLPRNTASLRADQPVVSLIDIQKTTALPETNSSLQTSIPTIHLQVRKS